MPGVASVRHIGDPEHVPTLVGRQVGEEDPAGGAAVFGQHVEATGVGVAGRCAQPRRETADESPCPHEGKRRRQLPGPVARREDLQPDARVEVGHPDTQEFMAIERLVTRRDDEVVPFPFQGREARTVDDLHGVNG
jgi:hypothetical protein